MATIVVFVENLLVMRSIVDETRPAGLNIGIPNNTLNLAQTVVANNNPKRLLPSNQLVFSQNAHNGLHVLSASNFLAIQQFVPKPKYKEILVSDLLAMTHMARTVLWNKVSQSINFSHAVNVWRGAYNQITFVGTAGYQIVKNAIASNTLALRQGIAVYQATNTYALNVTVAPSLGSYNPVLVQIPPVPVVYHNVILESDDLGLSTTLNVPLLDSPTDVIQHQRINRTTRAGDLIIFRDTTWPINEILTYKFSNLSAIESKNLLAFLNATVGYSIFLFDHEGVKWRGFILNPEASVTQSARAGCHSFDAEIKFQGDQV